MTFFLGLLGNRWVQYGLIVAAVLVFWRIWSNRIYDQGVAVGRVQATADIEKAKKAEWEAKEAELKSEAVNLEADRMEVDASRTELARVRSSLTSSLTKTIAEIKTRETVSGAVVSGIPADELDAALRELSASLGPPRP